MNEVKVVAISDIVYQLMEGHDFLKDIPQW